VEGISYCTCLWKGDETECTNHRGICLLPTACKILSIICILGLALYVGKIIGYHQCGFLRNRSTTEQMFCIRQILEKILEYNGTVHQLFIDFEKVYDSVRREVQYSILIELIIYETNWGNLNVFRSVTPSLFKMV